MTIPFAIGGAITGLIAVAIEDLMTDPTPDPEKVAKLEEAKDAAIQDFMSRGMNKIEAVTRAEALTEKLAQEVEASKKDVGFGDYVAGAATGAALGLVPFGAIAKGAGKLGGGVKSFLERQGMTPASRAMVGKTSDIRGMGAKTDISQMGAKTDIAGMGETSSLVGRSSPRPGAYSSRRAVPVGEAEDAMTGASSKLPPLKNADIWPEEKIAGNIGMKAPRTIDTTAERVTPAIGMSDDALLNREIDDVIDATMAARPKGIGMVRGLGDTTDIRGMGARTDIRGMGSKTDITGMGSRTDITGMGASSPSPLAVGGRSFDELFAKYKALSDQGKHAEATAVLRLAKSAHLMEQDKLPSIRRLNPRPGYRHYGETIWDDVYA
jgi:hypothetical protein